MKKILLTLFCFFVFETPLSAQELIPLFDDMPSFKEEQKSQPQPQAQPQEPKQAQTQSAQPSDDALLKEALDETQVKSQPIVMKNKTEQMPRLGRNAEPLESLVLAPFPGEDITLDLDYTRPAEPKKQFNETTPSLTEDDILKRDTPLTVTEEGGSRSRIDAMIEAKNNRRKGGKTNPLARHDVTAFEVAGLTLGILPDEVDGILVDNGFKLIKVEQSLPDVLRKSYEHACQKEVFGADELKECVDGYVNDMQTYYIKRAIYERAELREQIQIDFTTPLTQNIAYRITYLSKGDHSLGSSSASMLAKQQRRDEFWQLIFDTYGLPDDSDKLIWGDPENAYMKVSMTGTGCDGVIILEDLLVFDTDYLKLQEVAQEDKETKESQFGFATSKSKQD